MRSDRRLVRRAADLDDIDPLALALTDPEAHAQEYPDCEVMNADCNQDGAVNGEDIAPFVTRITGG